MFTMCGMDRLSPFRRVYLGYLSRSYALMHTLRHRTFMGVTLSTLARWLPILILLVGWIRFWPPILLAALIVFILWINYSLWRAKRDNYTRFVPEGEPLLTTESLMPLPPNQKVSVSATGLFSVSGRENNLLLSPATYWRVPLGEHVVMVEEQPGKFLYQFFNARNLQTIQPGWLLFGSRPIKSLAVSFLAQWGPEYTRFGQVYETGDDSDLPPARRVTVYLSTVDEETRRSVWHTIVSDARHARLDAG